VSAADGLKIVLLGVGTGVLSGFFGVGGGVLMVPGLVYFFSRTQQSAQSTSLAAMVLIALVGAIRYGVAGRAPELRIALVLAVAGMLGAYFLGAPLANRLPAKTLQHYFGALMLLVALHMMGVYGWIGQVLGRR